PATAERVADRVDPQQPRGDPMSSAAATTAATAPSTAAAAASENPVSGDGRPWWRDAVIYQVYLRSFADGDGDGVGDLAGLTQRLDHLTELGVDGLWLNPCYPSPGADHGYDVADYRDIDARYGGLP